MQTQLDSLKDFGLNTDKMKIHIGCHTEVTIGDSADDENAAVHFENHNLTTSGALFERDGSWILRDVEVTQNFQKTFDYDWKALA